MGASWNFKENFTRIQQSAISDGQEWEDSVEKRGIRTIDKTAKRFKCGEKIARKNEVKLDYWLDRRPNRVSVSVCVRAPATKARELQTSPFNWCRWSTECHTLHVIVQFSSARRDCTTVNSILARFYINTRDSTWREMRTSESERRMRAPTNWIEFHTIFQHPFTSSALMRLISWSTEKWILLSIQRWVS